MSINLNCAGHLLILDEPCIMGILNITHDSFYDGGKYKQPEIALSQVGKMRSEGASIIDIGAMSSRPGASITAPNEEIESITPVLNAISTQWPDLIISIDTIHSEVAEHCLRNGAHIINDISGGFFDPSMYKVIANRSAAYVMMHMQGLPGNMQLNPHYKNVTLDILAWFAHQIKIARSMGLNDIVIDLGFGFGKTIAHNYTLLKQLGIFKMLDLPILVGISRKSMIYKPLEIDATSALNGTTAIHMVALQNGAKILRVHDVKEAAECIKIYKLLYK